MPRGRTLCPPEPAASLAHTLTSPSPPRRRLQATQTETILSRDATLHPNLRATDSLCLRLPPPSRRLALWPRTARSRASAPPSRPPRLSTGPLMPAWPACTCPRGRVLSTAAPAPRLPRATCVPTHRTAATRPAYPHRHRRGRHPAPHPAPSPYTTRVACRLSPPPAHARDVAFHCDPHALSHAPQNSNFRKAKLTKARTAPGPFATQHPRRPVPHTPRAIPAAPLYTIQTDARTTVCDARPPRDDALHIQRLGARTGRQGARLVAALGARLGDHERSRRRTRSAAAGVGL